MNAHSENEKYYDADICVFITEMSQLLKELPLKKFPRTKNPNTLFSSVRLQWAIYLYFGWSIPLSYPFTKENYSYELERA